MRMLLFLPGLLLLLHGILALQASRAKAEAFRNRPTTVRIKAARPTAKAQPKTAAKAQRKTAAKAVRAEKTAVTLTKPASPAKAKPAPAPAGFTTGNNAFAGQRVAFTGRLPGMTRAEAIQAVQANGGRGYTRMPVGTTLLVVGINPGMCKMDKADEWIGQVRKITAAQFFDMLNAA